jgi:hypothetical protein
MFDRDESSETAGGLGSGIRGQEPAPGAGAGFPVSEKIFLLDQLGGGFGHRKSEEKSVCRVRAGRLLMMGGQIHDE